jgi:hypothetical protein
MKLLDMNPTPGAYAAEPLSASEIDAHPDADRIWATLMAVREVCEQSYDEGYDDGAHDFARQYA